MLSTATVAQERVHTDLLNGDLAWLPGQVTAADTVPTFLTATQEMTAYSDREARIRSFGGADNDEIHGDETATAALAASFHGDDYFNGEVGNDSAGRRRRQ